MSSRLTYFTLAVVLAVTAVPFVQQATAKNGLWKEIAILSLLLVAGGFFWISSRYLALWSQVILSALFALGLVAPVEAFGWTALKRSRHDMVLFSSEYWTEAVVAFLGVFVIVVLYLVICSIARKQLGRLEHQGLRSCLLSCSLCCICSSLLAWRDSVGSL